PAKTLADTAKSLTSGAEVSVALSTGEGAEGMIGFEGGGRRTTTRLLDREFPKYRALLPDSFNSIAEVNKAEFIEAVKRVSLVAERNTPLRLALGERQAVLEAGTGDEAQAVEVPEARGQGAATQTAFNSGFPLGGLSAGASASARLPRPTSTQPAIISGTPAADEAGSGCRYLIMPVRLSGCPARGSTCPQAAQG